MKKDPFCHCKKGEELLGSGVSYLSAIDAFMYLTNCTCPNIAFLCHFISQMCVVPFQPKDIGMISNIYCATSKEQLL